MVRLKWTNQAVEDLKNIKDFIANDSPHYAKITVFKIRERSKLLKKFPRSGRVVPEIENNSIRELIEGHYRIIYRVLSKMKLIFLLCTTHQDFLRGV